VRSFLVVDDDGAILSALQRELAGLGMRVRTAGDAGNLLAQLALETVDVVLLDLNLGEDWGLDLLPKIRELAPSAKVVVMSGFGSIVSAVEAMKLGATHFLSKPVRAAQVFAALSSRPGRRETELPSLARVEWEHLQRVLVSCGGNISEAARRLHIHRRSLQRKLARRTPPPD